jgi:hypothetical protein
MSKLQSPTREERRLAALSGTLPARVVEVVTMPQGPQGPADVIGATKPVRPATDRKRGA